MGEKKAFPGTGQIEERCRSESRAKRSPSFSLVALRPSWKLVIQFTFPMWAAGTQALDPSPVASQGVVYKEVRVGSGDRIRTQAPHCVPADNLATRPSAYFPSPCHK